MQAEAKQGPETGVLEKYSPDYAPRSFSRVAIYNVIRWKAGIAPREEWAKRGASDLDLRHAQ